MCYMWDEDYYGTTVPVNLINPGLNLLCSGGYLGDRSDDPGNGSRMEILFGDRTISRGKHPICNVAHNSKIVRPVKARKVLIRLAIGIIVPVYRVRLVIYEIFQHVYKRAVEDTCTER